MQHTKAPAAKRVSFSVTAGDRQLIDAIVDRAKRLYRQTTKRNLDTLECQMDVTACHANGNPLRLADLLVADDFNFGHDVFGISRHIDRSSGALLDCFVPRFSLPTQGGAQ